MGKAQLQYTPLEDIPKIRERLRNGFRSGKTKSIAFRREQLKQIGYMMQENKQAFMDAFKVDLGRPEFESDVVEFVAAVASAKDAYDHVHKWSKTESAPFSIASASMGPKVRKEAKGTVMIIFPFNFPLFLGIVPLVAAVAAGNTVLFKPSELSAATAALYGELIPKYLDPDVVQVVQGAVAETTKLLELQWDHISYTGSQRVARIVSTAAAKHLTPVTLELGGKSPVIIDPKSDLRLAARRIWWGKVCNAGQICVTPDYILVPREVQDELIKELKIAHEEFFPEGVEKSESYGRIVSVNHVQRIGRLIKETKGDIVLGGEVDVDKLYIAPTIINNPAVDEPVMQEEIFGPVMPIIPVEDVDEAIGFVNAREHPLAIYVFSQSSKFKSKVVNNTQSGAFAANELIIHVAAHGLPFGGTGPSGSGQLHGKYGFDTFTHFRACVDQPGFVDTVLMWRRYPPYNTFNQKFLGWLTSDAFPARGSGGFSSGWRLWTLVTTVIAVFAAVLV